MKQGVKCNNCGYEWETKSELFNVTCPRCGYKTPIKNIRRITNENETIITERGLEK